jgi:hypothetical protein
VAYTQGALVSQGTLNTRVNQKPKSIYQENFILVLLGVHLLFTFMKEHVMLVKSEVDQEVGNLVQGSLYPDSSSRIIFPGLQTQLG